MEGEVRAAHADGVGGGVHDEPVGGAHLQADEERDGVAGHNQDGRQRQGVGVSEGVGEAKDEPESAQHGKVFLAEADPCGGGVERMCDVGAVGVGPTLAHDFRSAARFENGQRGQGSGGVGGLQKVDVGQVPVSQVLVRGSGGSGRRGSGERG